MKNNFGVDLKVARRQSGLSQADCAYLLQISLSRMSKLEAGVRELKVSEMCSLCIVYGYAVSPLCQSRVERRVISMRQRLATLPDYRIEQPSQKKRRETLEVLARRLEALSPTKYAG